MVLRVWERERKQRLPCNGADRGHVAWFGTSPETEPTSRWCSHSRTFRKPTQEAKQMTTVKTVGAASHTPDGFLHRRASRT